MNTMLIDADTVAHQKMVFCLDTATKLDRDTFLSLASNKSDENAGDLFIIDISRCLLAGNLHELRKLIARSGFIKQPYLVLLKRACQYLCTERANDVIKTVLELESTGISNPLCYVLAAEAQLMNHAYTEAFHNFTTAANRFTFIEHLIVKSRCCLPFVEATKYSTPLEAGAMAYLQDERFDSSAIAPLVASLLKYKYQLNSKTEGLALEPALLDKIKQDAFLREALQKTLLPDPDVELFIIEIRKDFINSFDQEIKLNDPNFFLLCALSIQSYLNEHVHFVAESESNTVNLIQKIVKDLLSQPSTPSEKLTHLLLLISLYEPLSEQAYFSQLLKYQREAWPTTAQPCLEKVLYHPNKELEHIESISRLTSISNETSLLVGSQYEANPYPRWQEVNQIKNEQGYAKYNGINRPPFLKAKHFDKPLKMLVAGCGTGKHPIALALKFPDMNITAIDLSRRSLAYATTMARKFNITNISFHQADILELSEYKERFNIIESMGVLHHMQDPAAGLELLKGLLIKKGVMKIGLYSQIARKEITKFREKNTFEVTKSNIRSMRYNAITEDREGYVDCLNSSDFYSTSMCRDLLFHSQEHTFSLIDIESTLRKSRLLFKGFTFNNREPFNKFQSDYPSKLLDLISWHQFEQRNPLTFAGMYQFYVQIN